MLLLLTFWKEVGQIFLKNLANAITQQIEAQSSSSKGPPNAIDT